MCYSLEGEGNMRKYSKAFTLIEILVVVAIIITLVGLFLSSQQGATDKAKIVKTRYLLNKITEGIKLYETDWGELPLLTSYLIGNDHQIAAANDKKITLTNAREYISGLPTINSNGYDFITSKFFCPKYDKDPAGSHLDHANNVSTPVYVQNGGPSTPKYYYCYKNGGPSSCFEEVALRDETYKKNYNVITFAADVWGNMIYYTRIKDSSKNIVGYVLISPGPDGKTSYDGNQGPWIVGNGVYTFNSTKPEDKDNVVLCSLPSAPS
jgi:prepilin-type N-terminal cleavage/methylation domain-containing protein